MRECRPAAVGGGHRRGPSPATSAPTLAHHSLPPSTMMSPSSMYLDSSATVASTGAPALTRMITRLGGAGGAGRGVMSTGTAAPGMRAAAHRLVCVANGCQAQKRRLCCCQAHRLLAASSGGAGQGRHPPGALQRGHKLLDVLEPVQPVSHALLAGARHRGVRLLARAVVHGNGEALLGHVQRQVLRAAGVQGQGQGGVR